MKRLSLPLILFAFAFAPTTSQAQVIASDDFSYPDGLLTDQPDSPWANHSGAEGQLMVIGGQAVIQNGDSEDVNISFDPVTSGILTATFDVTVNDDENIGVNGTNFQYFVNFFDSVNASNTFPFTARVSTVAPTGDGNYTFGISSSEGLEDATFADNDFDFGETVSIVLTYDVTSGVATLTANGQTITGNIGADAGLPMDRFALRQAVSGNNETITLDNLVISLGTTTDVVLGDVNLSGVATFADIGPFIVLLGQTGAFQAEADTNGDGLVTFGDIGPFITILANQGT